MKKLSVLLFALVFALSLGFAQGSSDKGTDAPYPNKRISFVVPYAAGDGLDTSTRALLDNAGFPVATVVENIVGGSGTIGYQEVFSRKADGYTVLILSNGPAIAQPLMNTTLTYKLDDWQILTYTTAPVLAVIGCNPRLGLKTSEDLREYFLNVPEYTVGVPSMTGFGYVAATAMFNQLGVFDKVRWVGYDGAPALYQAYLSGEVDFVTFDDNFAAQYVNAGENVIVGVTMADSRSQYFPEVAAASEWGCEGLGGNIGFKAAAVKKGTPQDAIDYLTDIINKAVITPEYQQWCRNNYFGVITAEDISSSEEITERLFALRSLNEEVFKSVGIL